MDKRNIATKIDEANPSQNHWELEQLYYLIEPFNPKVIVEIGVHMGGSLRFWESVFNPLVLVGIENSTSLPLPKNVIIGDSKSEETKNELVKRLNGREIDFLYIDGDHRYEGVKHDFEMYLPLIRKPGGIIGFHDINVTHSDCGVYKFWEEIKGKYKSVRIENPKDGGTGVGIIWLE